MTDRILLTAMRFSGHHGMTDEERSAAQPFEVDVELELNLQPAAIDDDIARTVDYGRVFEICRELVESTTYRLLEAMAEGIAHEILRGFPVAEVVVRVRKLKVPVDGKLRYAAVEIRRARSADRHRE
ncbi:MAG: dihydroneopterin aldolase [Candidatus Limnocylindrales bacterium]